MQSTLSKSLLLGAAIALPSHAILGLGGHWAPSPGLEVKSSNASILQRASDSVAITQGSLSGLNGFGVKLWIDALPFVDVEATGDVQWGFYNASVYAQGAGASDTVPLRFKTDLPGVKEGRPAYGRVITDVSVTYPFLTFPPALSLAKLYVGAGGSYALSTQVLNAKFAKKALAKAQANNSLSATPTNEEVEAALVKEIQDEGLTSGAGFHLIAGVRVKPPIIPIAAYADVKYHILGSMPAGVDANSITFELGGGLAF